MIRFTLKRLVRAFLSILGVVTIVFVIPRLLGDPVLLMTPIDTPPEILAQISRDMGLDRPVHIQYVEYVLGVFRGDFGRSYIYRTDVINILLARFPATLQLSLAAMFWVVTIGLPLGLIAAKRPGTRIDDACRTLAVLGFSVPGYFVAILLLYFFSIKFDFFPSRGPDAGLASLRQLVLPSLALGAGLLGPVARLTRSAMLEVLNSDYVAMVRLRGAPERKVFAKHALRNAMVPVLTYLGLMLAALLGGVVIIETIFAWPGIGRAAIQAINGWDFPLVQAVTIWGSAVYVMINFLVDVTYGVIDPRIRQ